MKRALAAALSLCGALPAGAQNWRTIDVSRQLRDTAEQRVRVEYSAGRFDLRPTADPVLYSMQLRYDEDRGEPVHRFDAAERVTILGLHRHSAHIGGPGGERGGEMRLTLPRAVPLDLSVSLGAAKADLELGGLALRNLHVESGATDASLRFSAPNPGHMRALEIEVGAGSVALENLANANTALVSVQGGVGAVDLDFGGTWTQDVELEMNVALGKLAVHVPSEVGVRVEVDKVLASFDHESLAKRGNAYVSDNYDGARYKLRVHVSTVFGGIVVDRASP